VEIICLVAMVAPTKSYEYPELDWTRMGCFHKIKGQ